MFYGVVLCLENAAGEASFWLRKIANDRAYEQNLTFAYRIVSLLYGGPVEYKLLISSM